MKHTKLLTAIAGVAIAGAILAASLHSTTDAQKLYDILRDDRAGGKNWVDAAYRLTLPADVTVTGPGAARWPSRKPGVIIPLKGEPLRGKVHPSLLELMATRAADISKGGENGLGVFAMDDACRMVLFAADWDPQGAKSALADQMQRTLAFIPAGPSNVFPSAQDQLTQRLAKITVARVRAGDTQALTEYGQYMRTFDLDRFQGSSLADCLEPFWRFPQDKAVQDATADLFLKSTAWSFFPQKDTFGIWARGVFTSPMLGVEPFRQYVIARLKDTRQLAMIPPPYNAPSPVTVKNQWMQRYLGVEPSDPFAPAKGEIAVRVCDVYASALSQVPGLPWVAWYWPAEKRDTARALMIERLERYGARYAYVPLRIPGDPDADRQEAPDVFLEQARMTFAPLNHPASSTDVKKGLAIFSLEGLGDRRIVPLPSFPLRARWTALTEHTVTHQTYDTKTHTSDHVPFIDQSGLIWQAEELNQNGKWVRYYGFVGQDVLAKVPADQIEFLKAGQKYFPSKQLALPATSVASPSP